VGADDDDVMFTRKRDGVHQPTKPSCTVLLGSNKILKHNSRTKLYLIGNTRFEGEKKDENSDLKTRELWW